MTYYAFKAERFSYNMAAKLFAMLQEDHTVIAAGMDHTFADHIYMVAECSISEAEQIQHKIRQSNRMTNCQFQEISNEEVAAMMV